MSINHGEEVIQYIKNSTKTTPVKVYVDGKIAKTAGIKVFDCGKTTILIGDYSLIKPILAGSDYSYHIENDCRNSAIPLLDLKNINARIEPGAFIRDKVEIGNNVVIMMGATINIGSVIGDGTMIDMNTVLGGRAIVGKNCHIGAGSVLAGVIEPPSANPVVVEDNVVIGANAVVLEGVRIGAGSVVAAGAIVTKNVPSGVVVAGAPAKIIKKVDQKTEAKTEIVADLRKL